ncbi:PGPGW domain-containing protein [Benzoatithermus flavus]|uniref:PGPGW domain-containing protein n=1 Tax=Benzoatithermus flavus TaxID=3108223 RepID=A0ABU8XN04_9PROT
MAIGLGYGFLALGVLGLFLPILQGVLFIVIGLLILSRYTAWAERLLARLAERHPRLYLVIERAEVLLSGWRQAVAARLGRLFPNLSDG